MSSSKSIPAAILLLAILMGSGLARSPPALVGNTGVHPPSGIPWYVPITITNSQASGTPAPFEQMVEVNSSAYADLEAADLSNIEFFNSTGQIIPSWRESGNSNMSGSSVYWLNLAQGVPAGSSEVVYMGFAARNVILLNAQQTGEAPQLSPIYGLFDDGGSVFRFYDNFAGVTLKNLWGTYAAGGTVSVHNGATISAPALSGSLTMFTAANYGAGVVFDADVTNLFGNGAYALIGQSTVLPNSPYSSWQGYTSAYLAGGGTPPVGKAYDNLAKVTAGTMSPLATGNNAATLPQVLSLAWPATGVEAAQLDYGQTQSSTDASLSLPSKVYFSVTDYANAVGGSSTTISWTRARAAPPGLVMPQVSFGNVVPSTSTTAVACTPPAVPVFSPTSCTAVVTGAYATGTVDWSNGNLPGSFTPASCTLAFGSCTVSYVPMSPASPVVITASYGGDSSNPPSSGTFSLKVKAISQTTISCSSSSIMEGSSISCSASVAGAAPTGPVVWSSDKQGTFSPSGECLLAGGTCTVSYVPHSSASSVTITGKYLGDADNGPSSGSLMLLVISTSTSSTSTTSSSSTTSSTSTVSTTSSTSTSTTSTRSTTSTTSTIADFPPAVLGIVAVAALAASAVITKTWRRGLERSS